MSATFLATGFEPFGQHITNSSWDALELLSKHWPDTIVARRLPVDYRAAHELLRQALSELQPRAVLCTGLAKGRVFRMERHARRPDALRTEAGELLATGRWPWDEMRGALERSGVDAIDSTDAGQYVCESTYWSLLTYPQGLGSPELPAPEFAGFLHVPHVADEMSLQRIADAVGRVIDARHTDMSEPALLSGL